MAGTKKRAGKTETFSVSVDAATKEQLKAAADRLHQGNMSRLFTAVARRLTEDAAFDRAWQWYGGALPTAEETAAIDEWIDSVVKPRRRRKKAA
ncbi:MAG: hypothetical protein HYZ29_27900 [Myxococcales bacterium]|nr:hypothetical protein [Myxococcales bacterium]